VEEREREEERKRSKKKDKNNKEKEEGRGGGGGEKEVEKMGHRIKAKNGNACPLPLGRNCRFWSHLVQRAQKGGEQTFLPIQ